MPDATSRFSLDGKPLFHYMGTSTFSILRTFDRAYAVNRSTQLTPELFETADEAFDTEMDDLDAFLRVG